MKVSITGRHMDLTDAIRDYVENGLEKVRGHFDRVINVDVILSVEKHRRIAEINLHANGLRINAKESSSDMYLSVDAALEKVEKQVSKHKGRILRHQPRRSHEDISYQHHVIEVDGYEDDNGQEVAEPQVHRVVLRERIVVKPMSVDEATLQLDLLADAFLVFSNPETQKLNIIYSRDDGTYGLIEPTI